MSVEIVTKDDLQQLRFQIVEDVKDLLKGAARDPGNDMRGYKSVDVREMLDCSEGKIKSLRSAGRIRGKKIGGTWYYNKEDVRRMMTSGF